MSGVGPKALASLGQTFGEATPGFSIVAELLREVTVVEVPVSKQVAVPVADESGNKAVVGDPDIKSGSIMV